MPVQKSHISKLGVWLGPTNTQPSASCFLTSANCLIWKCAIPVWAWVLAKIQACLGQVPFVEGSWEMCLICLYLYFCMYYYFSIQQRQQVYKHIQSESQRAGDKNYTLQISLFAELQCDDIGRTHILGMKQPCELDYLTIKTFFSWMPFKYKKTGDIPKEYRL